MRPSVTSGPGWLIEWTDPDAPVDPEAQYVIPGPIEQRRRAGRGGNAYTHGGRPLAWIDDPAEWTPPGEDCGPAQEGDMPSELIWPNGPHHRCGSVPANAEAQARGEGRIFSCDWRIGTPLDPREVIP